MTRDRFDFASFLGFINPLAGVFCLAGGRNSASLRSRRSQLSAILLGLTLVTAPLARANDDDDLPEGDADYVEKPKKKEEKKKPPPKKEEKKKEEKKEAPPPPPPPPPKEEKKPPPPPVDDDDILTGDDDELPPSRTPKKEDPKKDTLAEDVLADDDEDDLPARPREAVKEERKPLPTSRLDADDDELPSRTNRSVKPIEDRPTPPPAPRVRKTVDGDGAEVEEVTKLDTPVEEPGETEETPTGLIVGGAIGGAVVVLAGAGVGGFFLFQALQTSAAGTVTITPR